MLPKFLIYHANERKMKKWPKTIFVQKFTSRQQTKEWNSLVKFIGIILPIGEYLNKIGIVLLKSFIIERVEFDSGMAIKCIRSRVVVWWIFEIHLVVATTFKNVKQTRLSLKWCSFCYFFCSFSTNKPCYIVFDTKNIRCNH